MNNPTCTLCGSSQDEHGLRRHPFTPHGGVDNDTAWLGHRDEKMPPPQVMPAPIAPFDPVLRQALIDKGILTTDDLQDAERKIHSISGGLWGGVDNGQRPEQGQ